MSGKTSIEWTDVSWNPTRGCSRKSTGCENCFAERIAARFSGPGMPYEGMAITGRNGPRWTGEVRLAENALLRPLSWREPRRIFVNSMSDLFHERLSDRDIHRVFAVMQASPQHTFQVLTKRPDRMRAYMTGEMRGSYRKHKAAWKAVLDRAEVTLCCFCPDPAFSHRTVLAKILGTMKAQVCGERGQDKAKGTA